MSNLQIIANNNPKLDFLLYPLLNTPFYTVILTKTLKGQVSGFQRAWVENFEYLESVNQIHEENATCFLKFQYWGFWTPYYVVSPIVSNCGHWGESF